MAVVLSVLVYIVYVLTMKKKWFIFMLVNNKIRWSEGKRVKRQENGIETKAYRHFNGPSTLTEWFRNDIVNGTSVLVKRLFNDSLMMSKRWLNGALAMTKRWLNDTLSL